MGDGGTSNLDCVGFDIIHDFEIPMNDNKDEKLLNKYTMTETCVDDDSNTASLSGTTELCLPEVPTG